MLHGGARGHHRAHRRVRDAARRYVTINTDPKIAIDGFGRHARGGARAFARDLEAAGVQFNVA